MVGDKIAELIVSDKKTFGSHITVDFKNDEITVE
jgi:hypothetical protein